jgi:peroxiredoxin
MRSLIEQLSKHHALKSGAREGHTSRPVDAEETKMLTGKRRSLNALALVLVVALACVSAPALPASGAAAAAQASPLNFSLRTTEGGEISSEMLRGDIVVLAFGASWLPLSRAQVQGVQQLANEYGPRNVRVYWVSTDSVSPKSKNYATDEQLRAFAKKNGLKIAVLRDPDGALFKQTGANQLPAIVILDRAGNVSGAPIGGLDPNPKVRLVDQLSGRLNQLLGGSS